MYLFRFRRKSKTFRRLLYLLCLAGATALFAGGRGNDGIADLVLEAARNRYGAGSRIVALRPVRIDHVSEGARSEKAVAELEGMLEGVVFDEGKAAVRDSLLDRYDALTALRRMCGVCGKSKGLQLWKVLLSVDGTPKVSYVAWDPERNEATALYLQ